MLANSSSSSDSHLTQNVSVICPDDCFFFEPSSFIFTMFCVANIIILLPLCVFILYRGLQQWRQTRSTSSTMSHSDCFTYHMVVIELIGVFGCFINCCGYHRKDLTITRVSGEFFSFTWYGQIMFHMLTCVDRYLAIVHPITYMRLRNERWIRIRNISVGCVWLLCTLGIVLVKFKFLILDFCVLFSSILITSFCSFSVLCVLIRPGPGHQGGGRGKVDQVKLRAFYTILAILGVLVMRFAFGLEWTILFLLKENCDCSIIALGVWISLPNSLVLPLLFLQKSGNLVCCKNSTYCQRMK